jgi:hypothetical protein
MVTVMDLMIKQRQIKRNVNGQIVLLRAKVPVSSKVQYFCAPLLLKISKIQCQYHTEHIPESGLLLTITFT